MALSETTAIVEVKTVSEFNDVISKGIVCVDFWAPWCGPCIAFLPTFQAVASKTKSVTFCKVNIDDLSDIANMYKVRSIPTILLFKDGKAVNQNIGSLNEMDLISFIESAN